MGRNDCLEPRTDVPALEDWSTDMVLAQSAVGVRTSAGLAVASLGVAVALLVLVPPDPGTIAAVVVLVLFGLLTALIPITARMETSARRRRLLDGPWQRCAAAVAVEEDGALHDRLIVHRSAETLVLKGFLIPFPAVVAHRQEVFLCGPDDDGRALLRVAGMLRIVPAKLDPRPAQARERELLLPGRPLDDPGAARASRSFRWGTRLWLVPAVLGVCGAVVVTLALRPLAVPGLVVGGLLLIAAAYSVPIVVMFVRWFAEALAGLCAAREWSPVPITMFPWEPGREVAGLAQLPRGTALVQFPYPQPDVVANVSDSGMMWMAGDGIGAVAVGVPGVPVMTFCVVTPDSDTPVEAPRPWLLRTQDPVLDKIPSLRG
ncbi:MAG: putative rane protein [Pseudonocardia sp.]|nr:putative rane protein [Pseudonocardia sp.]